MLNLLKRIRQEYKYILKKTWSLTEVGNHWNETIDYDDLNSKTDSYFRRFTDAYKLYSIPNNSYVLDICCRTGNGTLFFFKQGKIRESVCADVSEKMLSICADKLNKINANFETVLFNNFPLPFQSEKFEVILCFETIEHISNPDMFLKELTRVIKPNGIIILTTPNIIWEPIHWLAAILNLHHSEGPSKFLRRKYIIDLIGRTNSLKILKEQTTVLVPLGPNFLLKFGEWFERLTNNTLTKWFGLRRIFICQKLENVNVKK
jgi:ubiquinone/menaquinone biosynthesis C-methylase UbiE